MKILIEMLNRHVELKSGVVECIKRESPIPHTEIKTGVCSMCINAGERYIADLTNPREPYIYLENRHPFCFPMLKSTDYVVLGK